MRLNEYEKLAAVSVGATFGFLLIGALKRLIDNH